MNVQNEVMLLNIILTFFFILPFLWAAQSSMHDSPFPFILTTTLLGGLQLSDGDCPKITRQLYDQVENYPRSVAELGRFASHHFTRILKCL